MFVNFLMFHHSSLVILLFCYFGYTARKLTNNNRHFCNEVGRCSSSTFIKTDYGCSDPKKTFPVY